jgi:threonine synthase
MDIQVSSNFERMMFDLAQRDSDRVRSQMETFAQSGSIALNDTELESARDVFLAQQVDDKTTKQLMATLAMSDDYVADPHTAVGLQAAMLLDATADPRVTLSTAHPVKFGAAVEAATGTGPSLPPHMADLYEREEAFQVLDNNAEALQTLVRAGTI